MSTITPEHSCDAGGGAPRSWNVQKHIGSLALRKTGGAIVALRDCFYALDLENGACSKLADPDPGKPRIRMNDGKVDRQGRFVAGYVDYEGRDPICGLFRLDPTGSVVKLDDGIVCSNGPCWSPDGRTFYFADTYTREIWAYDYDTDTGEAADRHVFCYFPAAASRACQMAQPSTRKDSSGACRSTRASSPASTPTASSTASSDFPSRARPA